MFMNAQHMNEYTLKLYIWTCMPTGSQMCIQLDDEHCQNFNTAAFKFQEYVFPHSFYLVVKLPYEMQ